MNKNIAIAVIAVALLGGAAVLFFPPQEPDIPQPEGDGPIMRIAALCEQLPDPAATTAAMAELGWQPLPDERIPEYVRAEVLAKIAAWSVRPDFDGAAEMASLEQQTGFAAAELLREDRKDWYQHFTRDDGSFADFQRDPRLPGSLSCSIVLKDTADIADFDSYLRSFGVESEKSAWARTEMTAALFEPPGLITGYSMQITDPAAAEAALGAPPEFMARAMTYYRQEGAE